MTETQAARATQTSTASVTQTRIEAQLGKGSTPPQTSAGGVKRRQRSLASEIAVDVSPVLVGVYIRVSMVREEMISPKLQQRDIDTYLSRMKAQTGRAWRTVVVEQDLDISGRSFDRGGIQRLMTAMREGTITMIVTYRYDRFGRNLAQALIHLKEVEALGGQVLSVTEPMDATTAIGHYMRSQTLALAELQSQQIGEGWKRVHQYRLDRGLPTNGRERYGYLAHRTTQPRGDAIRLCPQGCELGKCQTGFVPDPETAPVVQRIYAEYIGGWGFQRIAHGLNDDGIPTPGQVADRRSGNPARLARSLTTRWSAGSVIDVADTGFAVGLISHLQQWLPGSHEPLITQAQWTEYQDRREAQRLVPTKARSPHWALAGVAVCGECGGPMYCTSSPRGEQYALYCGTARTSGVCRGVYRTRGAVEAAVEMWLQSVVRQLKSPSRLILAPPVTVARLDPSKGERRALGKVLDSSTTKVSRLLDAYTDGALDLAEYKRRREDIQHEVERAQMRLAELDVPPQRPTAASINHSATVWATLDVDGRRDIVHDLLERVRIHADKTVELIPRWDEPVTIAFTQRNTVPVMPQPRKSCLIEMA
jgi:site-specific DNA recombinase